MYCIWTWFIQFTSSSVKIFLMDNWTCIVYGPGAVQYFFSVFSFLTVNSFSPLFLTVNKQVPLSQRRELWPWISSTASDDEGRSESFGHSWKLSHFSYSAPGGSYIQNIENIQRKKDIARRLVLNFSLEVSWCFLFQIQDLELVPTHHIVSGKSKRGWESRIYKTYIIRQWRTEFEKNLNALTNFNGIFCN